MTFDEFLNATSGNRNQRVFVTKMHEWLNGLNDVRFRNKVLAEIIEKEAELEYLSEFNRRNEIIDVVVQAHFAYFGTYPE